MTRAFRTISLAAMLLLAGCSATPYGVQKATLRCEDAGDGGSFIGFFSFADGMLAVPVDPEKVDLVYYFDGDDCSRGALMGRDDRPGFIYPIGRRTWFELPVLMPPSPPPPEIPGTPDDRDSVAAIAPLDRDAAGLAFWVLTSGGDFVLVRITAVHPATHANLVAGVVPTLILEWSRPRTRNRD